ncbi:MAG: Sodium/hydrogen exchanger [Cenarchaeum symbiont of Oopsacas minuta]|nr:Sodium/hydrogen exchanger [Cenarchaeum symbiont of Oopsacas minuta]
MIEISLFSLLDLIGEYLGKIDGLANMEHLHKLLEAISITDGSIASAPVILLAAGIVIFMGVIGESFFKKTGIPDVAFLMILGVILGPLLGIIRPDAVALIVPYFAGVALIIIMFDGGLNLDLKRMAKTAHFAIILALVGFIISVAAVAIFAHFLLEWEWLDSILLGSIVGGSSSVIVFGLVKNIQITADARSMLSFESAITDILATIIAFILFEAILTGQFSIQTLSQTVGRAMAVGLILGLGVGIPWMYITTKLGKAKHSYMLTLGVLFMLFFMANTFGESGALTALVFGLMLGNRNRVSKILRFKIRAIELDDSMHNQLTFLVRSFFFVFVGLLASFGQIEYAIFGIIVTVAVYMLRVAIVRGILNGRVLRDKFSLLDRNVTTAMIPRGLAAAVLATIPLTIGIPNAQAIHRLYFS